MGFPTVCTTPGPIALFPYSPCSHFRWRNQGPKMLWPAWNHVAGTQRSENIQARPLASALGLYSWHHLSRKTVTIICGPWLPHQLYVYLIFALYCTSANPDTSPFTRYSPHLVNSIFDWSCFFSSETTTEIHLPSYQILALCFHGLLKYNCGIHSYSSIPGFSGWTSKQLLWVQHRLSNQKLRNWLPNFIDLNYN